MFVSKYNQVAFKFIDTFDYNQAPPLTIIAGDEGLGKTTLLRYLFAKHRDNISPAIFVDAQKYSSKYSFAACKGDLKNFRQNMRSAKLLLLDNINALKGKNKTIEELLYTVDTVLSQGGKIVMTYRGKDFDVHYLGEKLASRLRSGLVLRLNSPTEEEIKNFINYYLNTNNLAGKNIHGLEVKAKNMKQAINVIKQAGQAAENKLTKETVDKVLTKVAAHLGVEVKRVLGPDKNRNVVKARYMTFILLHEKYNFTYPEIAAYFKKNSSQLKAKCKELKENQKELFETLCQKIYNKA
ncbi:MAG: chromosomal replication initiator DnaA [Peptococcaceae bacterium]|nr:chromosomal replication initiator DnaA [Peptococcaceae bacterium]